MKPKNRATHLVLLQRLSDGVLWLETKRENDSPTILSAGLEPYAAKADDQEPPTKAEALKAALHAINGKLRLGWMARHEVIVAAPSHRLTARFIDTPPVEADTLADLTAFEVSEALQVPIEKIAWDMHISSKHGEEAKKKLLWIAARKEYIDNLLHAWPEDRLSPTQLTPDFWAYYEFLLGNDAERLERPALLIAREEDRASITIADREAIYLTRSVPLNRPMRGVGDLEGAEAEEYALAMEIERTLYYAADKSVYAAPASMICCGFEDWNMDQIRRAAEGNRLQLAHLTLNDVRSKFVDHAEEREGKDIRPDHLPMLCIAYCQLELGVIGPNLLEIGEEPVNWKSFIPEAALPSRKFMMIGGGLAALFLLLAIGKSFWFNSAVAARLNRGEDLIKLANRLQKEEIALRQLTRTNVDYAQMFLFLAEKLPEGILVKNFSVDVKNGVELSLTGGNNKQAMDLQQTLNDSPYFREMVLERSVVEKEGFTIYFSGQMQASR
ncbi:MAG: PilN domain-containing protein [Candidatus Omnitrophica bacterium]|nr:PilN domain-containing protein [Candidatus Omnitrophota bacterium]